VDRFLDESQRRVDTNISTYYPSIISNRSFSFLNKNIKFNFIFICRWLAVRLELVGNLIVFFSALSAVLFRSSEHVTAGLAGLSMFANLHISNNNSMAFFLSHFFQFLRNAGHPDPELGRADDLRG
jgi:ATP-binding cassette, subfamily C (CFTR/MRP), member 1